MKAVLFLCLLAFMTCEKDIIDIGKCIYKAPKVQEIISEAMIAVITKNFDNLISKITESLPELIQIVIGCINEQPAIEDTPKASMIESWCEYGCYHGIYRRPPDQMVDCLKRCHSK